MADSAVSPSPLPLTRIMVRPIGTPLPLGFFAFGIGLVLAGALEIGLVPMSESHVVALTLVTFVAPLELAASALALLARDSAGGTSLGVFGASWVALAASLLSSAPGQHMATTAVLDFAVSFALVLLAIAAARAKPLFSALLTLAAARTVLLALGQCGLGQGFQRAAAIVGFCAAAVGFYGALALLLEDAAKKTKLPLGRKGNADRAIHGELDEQLAHLENEPGVRQQL